MINDNEVFSVWKSAGPTSFEVVSALKKSHKEKIKIGHCGALDPFAEGVIVICTGTKTKKIESIMALKKEYIATISLGLETDSLDLTGEVIKASEVPNIDENLINNVLQKFKGKIKQTAPYFSALKLNGVPLYKYARNDIFIRKKTRNIEIYDIRLLDYNSKKIQIYVKCGRGTYIRSLAKDIAINLNTLGYLTSLTRKAVGPFNKNNSIIIKDEYFKKN